MLEGVLDTGVATWADDQLLLIDRVGFPEESYITFSYSPILDESGGVGGILATAIETTERVLDARRIRTVSDLAASTVEARSLDEAAARAIECIGRHDEDLPFALLHVVDPEDGETRLAGAVGEPPEHPWPLAEAIATGAPVDARARAGDADRPSRGRRPARRARRRPEPAPARRRRLRALPGAGRRHARRHARRRPRPRRGAPARRGARRPRRREDRVLRQRLARVPHPADAAAHAGRGRAGRHRLAAAATPSARGSRSPAATRCGCSGSSTRCWTSRGSAPAGSPRPSAPPTSARRRPRWRARSAPRSRRPACASRSTRRRCPAPGSTATPGSGSCSTCSPTRSSTRSRGPSRCACGRAATAPS